MSKPRLRGLRIDIETRASEDLKKTGVYRYTEAPDFEVLVIAYSPIREYEDGTVKVGRPRALDLSDSGKVQRFRRILADPAYEKHAFNAPFERIALSRWSGLGTGTYLDPEGWYCSSVLASVYGVQGSLEQVARAVRAEAQKDVQGKRLIRLFSHPDRKTGRFHDTAECWCGVDHGEDFRRFVEYCKQDVATEYAVSRRFPPVPEAVQAQYVADQRINDRGIRHHRRLAERAVEQVEAEKDRLMAALKDLTGLDNPNSNAQMMKWVASRGYPMASLNKAARRDALADPLIPEEVAEALRLRGAASLSSVAKHKAALLMRCSDGRLRGTLQFYGAHTGREAGRGIQPQNLPRYEASDADRKRLLRGEAGADAPEIAKGTVRASLVPTKGNVFVVVDYNAIEARVLGFLAGESWVLAEFRGDGKIYEATAATMFGVNKKRLVAALVKCGKCGHCEACETRSKGKVANLALGYAGGAGALVTMGAADAGIDIGNYAELKAEWERAGKPGKFHEWETDRHDYPELLRLRDLYREASPATVGFWKQCNRAWDAAAMERRSVRFGNNGVLAMLRDGRHNRIILPSGRSIWYRFARSHVEERSDGTERVDRRTFIGKGTGVHHVRVDTHGGKLTENVTQAVARDVLFDLIMRLEEKTAAGWPGRLVLHVHDEVVLEVPEKKAEAVLTEVEDMMSAAPDWAPGLPLRGEGAVMDRYRK